jgi:hypothetical protein
MAPILPFGSFTRSCSRHIEQPLTRFWGSRPHPDLSMISTAVLWQWDDPNLSILPKWSAHGHNRTAPFVDTHIAVRFLGGVSNYSDAVDPRCSDATPRPGVAGIWCDLINSRLDAFFENGLDVMLVLDNVPWAFVPNAPRWPACQSYGCQYLPPESPSEFAQWVGGLAAYLVERFGVDWAGRVQWRLGTEANGPRWGGRGKYLGKYLESYRACAAAIHAVIPRARFGASNWVEELGKTGGLAPNSSDAFQYDFYSRLANDSSIPVDWISVSHYGTGLHGGVGDFPGADYVQRTPDGKRGRVELLAMRELARRPGASLEVQEWSILRNELGQPTFEPSSVGTAWTAASTAAWVCHGVDRIFHWESGTTLRNSSGDGRLVNFFEQHAWNMALLELFTGGRASFAVYEIPHAPLPLNHTVGLIESVDMNGTYFALVAAVGADRSHPFRTIVPLRPALRLDASRAQMYQMNSSVSVVECVLRELRHRPGMLQHDDGLPYDFGRLLTAQGRAYAEAPENLERYWRMHANTFKPYAFIGTWRQNRTREATDLDLPVTAPSVTVLVVPRMVPRL